MRVRRHHPKAAAAAVTAMLAIAGAAVLPPLRAGATDLPAPLAFTGPGTSSGRLVVPDGVCRIDFVLRGGSGGGSAGGRGGLLALTATVAAGDVYSISVGGAGPSPDAGTAEPGPAPSGAADDGSGGGEGGSTRLYLADSGTEVFAGGGAGTGPDGTPGDDGANSVPAGLAVITDGTAPVRGDGLATVTFRPCAPHATPTSVSASPDVVPSSPAGPRATSAPAVTPSISRGPVRVRLPAAPRKLSAAPVAAGARLSFTPPAHDGGGPILSYQVQVGTGGWRDLAVSGGGATRAATVSGLKPGLTYAMKVRAVNLAGPGAATGVVAFTVAVVPGVPPHFSAAAGEGTVLVMFGAADGSGNPLRSYQASVDNGRSWSDLATTGTRSLTGTITGLTGGASYRVAVRAVNVAGPGRATAAVPVTPAGFITENAAASHTPLAPIAVNAVAGTASITVSWTARVDSAVTGYTATASPGPATCTTKGTRCVLGAKAGTTYTVTVVAHAKSDDSYPSGASGEVTPSAPRPAAEPPAKAGPLTTTGGRITTVVPGDVVTVLGAGYAPYSTVVVAVYSAPAVLGRAVTGADGKFSLTVSMPSGLVNGSHTITATGVGRTGAIRETTLPVTVGATGDDSSGSGTARLPATGDGLFPIGVLLIVTGTALMLLCVRRRWTGPFVATPRL
jgi:hypothetical protein